MRAAASFTFFGALPMLHTDLGGVLAHIAVVPGLKAVACDRVLPQPRRPEGGQIVVAVPHGGALLQRHAVQGGHQGQGPALVHPIPHHLEVVGAGGGEGQPLQGGPFVWVGMLS